MNELIKRIETARRILGVNEVLIVPEHDVVEAVLELSLLLQLRYVTSVLKKVVRPGQAE